MNIKFSSNRRMYFYTDIHVHILLIMDSSRFEVVIAYFSSHLLHILIYYKKRKKITELTKYDLKNHTEQTTDHIYSCSTLVFRRINICLYNWSYISNICPTSVCIKIHMINKTNSVPLMRSKRHKSTTKQ